MLLWNMNYVNTVALEGSLVKKYSIKVFSNNTHRFFESILLSKFMFMLPYVCIGKTRILLQFFYLLFLSATLWGSPNGTRPPQTTCFFGNEYNLTMQVQKWHALLKIGPKSTYFRRFRNLMACFTIHVLGTKHDIDNWARALENGENRPRWFLGLRAYEE